MIDLKKNKLSDKFSFILLRWLSIFLMLFMLFFTTKDTIIEYFVVFLFILSNIVLSFIPDQKLFLPLFNYFIFIFDVIIISLCIWFSKIFDLYLLYFLAIYISAINQEIKGSIIIAFISAIIYSLIVFKSYEPIFLIRVPFFFIFALLNGFLVHIVKSRQEAKLVISEVKKMVKKKDSFPYDLKKANLEILNVAKHYISMIESMTSGIVVINNKGIIISFNKTAEEITGLKESNIIGKNILEISQISELGKLLMETLNTGIVSKRVELTISNIKGGNVYVGMTSSIMQDNTGKISNIVSIFSDLTNIKQTELYFRRTEKLSTIGKMTAAIAHEIKNPLHSIMGFTQILKEYPLTEEMKNKYLQIVINEIQRLNKVILSILDFSKNPQIGFQQVDINDIIKETVNFFKNTLQEKKIELILNLYESLKINGNPEQIKSVFFNIILNAIESMPNGGNLKVTTETSNNELLIFIKDTGCGIPKEIQEKIFEPFFTTKETGVGLGLSNVQSIIDTHRGKINVESEENKGSTFIITLPILKK